MIRNKEQKEKHRLSNQKWYHSHKIQIKEKALAWRYTLKLTVFSHYSKADVPSCAHCGITDIDILCLDHIQNGGCQHRIRLGNKGGLKFYSILKQQGYPEGYQVLCANCNLKKAMVFRRNGNSL